MMTKILRMGAGGWERGSDGSGSTGSMSVESESETGDEDVEMYVAEFSD